MGDYYQDGVQYDRYGNPIVTTTRGGTAVMQNGSYQGRTRRRNSRGASRHPDNRATRPTAGRTSRPLTAKQKQALLIKHGYVIGGADGKWGQRSKAAWANYQSARKNGLDLADASSYWNQHSRWGARAQTRTNSAQHPDSRHNSPNHHHNNFGGSGGASGGGGGGAAPADPTQALIQRLLGGGGGGGNVLSDAEALTAAEFDAPMDALRRDISEHERRSKQSQIDIENWFDQLLAESRDYNAADDRALNQALNSHSGLMQNILGSLGDEAAKYNVGRTALYNEGGLKAIGLSEGNYNRNMLQALGLKGKETRLQQQRMDDEAFRELQGGLMDLIKGRSSKLVENRIGLEDRALKNKSAQIDQLATLLLLPGQLEGQQLDLLGKALDNSLAEAEMAGAGQPKPMSQPERRQVAETIWKNIVHHKSPGAPWRLGRNATVKRINSMLKSYGINPWGPEGKSIREGLLKRGGMRLGARGNPIG